MQKKTQNIWKLKQTLLHRILKVIKKRQESAFVRFFLLLNSNFTTNPQRNDFMYIKLYSKKFKKRFTLQFTEEAPFKPFLKAFFLCVYHTHKKIISKKGLKWPK